MNLIRSLNQIREFPHPGARNSRIWVGCAGVSAGTRGNGPYIDEPDSLSESDSRVSAPGRAKLSNQVRLRRIWFGSSGRGERQAEASALRSEEHTSELQS